MNKEIEICLKYLLKVENYKTRGELRELIGSIFQEGINQENLRLNEKIMKIRCEIGYYVGSVIKRRLTESELEELDWFISKKILNNEIDFVDVAKELRYLDKCFKELEKKERMEDKRSAKIREEIIRIIRKSKLTEFDLNYLKGTIQENIDVYSLYNPKGVKNESTEKSMENKKI